MTNWAVMIGADLGLLIGGGISLAALWISYKIQDAKRNDRGDKRMTNEPTCTMIQKPTIDPYIDTLKCSECGHTKLFSVRGEKMPKHCSECGAKVISH